MIIHEAVPVPSGSDILLLQRETVNDAWDLPREATFKTFFQQHSQWSDYVRIEGPFEWQWYYAFQQVGDQRVEILSKTYREGRLRRDHLASWASILSPPSLLKRLLQDLAGTNICSVIAYEDRVRAFHAQLIEYYYPRFYQNIDFNKSELKALPAWQDSASK